VISWLPVDRTASLFAFVYQELYLELTDFDFRPGCTEFSRGSSYFGLKRHGQEFYPFSLQM